MREEIVIPPGKYISLKNVFKYRWIQLKPQEHEDRVLDGKYHPKLTFLNIGYTSEYNKKADVVNTIDLYGNTKQMYGTTICKPFPIIEQKLLMDEYGEVLLEKLTEQQINEITKEIKSLCIV
jgi:hypothetical protein